MLWLLIFCIFLICVIAFFIGMGKIFHHPLFKTVFMLLMGMIFVKGGSTQFWEQWQLAHYRQTFCTLIKKVPQIRNNITFRVNGEDAMSYCPVLWVHYQLTSNATIVQTAVKLACVKGAKAQTTLLDNYQEGQQLVCWYGNVKDKEVMFEPVAASYLKAVLKIILGILLIGYGILSYKRRNFALQNDNTVEAGTPTSQKASDIDISFSRDRQAEQKEQGVSLRFLSRIYQVRRRQIFFLCVIIIFVIWIAPDILYAALKYFYSGAGTIR